MNGFYWERRPEAEAFILHYLDLFCRRSARLKGLGNRLIQETSSGILHWTDHVLVEDSEEMRRKLGRLGFSRSDGESSAANGTSAAANGTSAAANGTSAAANGTSAAFHHPGALLPAVYAVGGAAGMKPGIALRVERLESFLGANDLKADIEGPELSPCRRAFLGAENGVSLWAVERRGTRALEPAFPPEGYAADYAEGIAAWNSLRKNGDGGDGIWEEIGRTVGDLVSKIGTGPASHLVCECEREYWLAGNAAGRAQKKRQDKPGFGWANHDHHTLRSSRRNFSRLIALFLRLGFEKRERFYAGEEAGWGAQVMEHPAAGLVLFLDVDLASEEVNIDFSASVLEDRETLGTVGLWCALHGDSILKAGMHHLAARFNFSRLIEDMQKLDIPFMPPFSDFSYLRQAFSIAEIRQADPARVQKLLQDRRISEEQADRFMEKGAVGSHLENIERREGYKGFNRKNVSAIIRDTDPRNRIGTR